MKSFSEIITSSDYNAAKTRAIVKEKHQLSSECRDVPDDWGGVERVVQLLFNTMVKREGIGLSANQIGITRKICVVNVNQPFYLVNPRITDHDGMTPYVESCLSFPDETLKTKRHIRVTVQADNFDAPLSFGPPASEWDDAEDLDINHPDMLESVAVQHEIDHLNGITFHQRRIGYQEPHINESRIGRNDKVVVRNTNDITETKTLKYKHVKKLEGDWQILGTANSIQEFEIDLN